MEWRKSVVSNRINVSSVVEQPLDRVEMAKPSGVVQRSAFIFRVSFVYPFRIGLHDFNGAIWKAIPKIAMGCSYLRSNHLGDHRLTGNVSRPHSRRSSFLMLL